MSFRTSCRKDIFFISKMLWMDKWVDKWVDKNAQKTRRVKPYNTPFFVELTPLIHKKRPSFLRYYIDNQLFVIKRH